MRHIAQVDDQGRILAVSKVPDHVEPLPGELEVHPAFGTEISPLTHRIRDGALVAEPSFERGQPDYRERRRDVYPPLEDLADALVKLHSGQGGPMSDYVARCLEVKAAHPKPEGP